ncbi:hypothetical protein VEHSUH05_01155 [Veillonella denticariosi JCM 15641]|uniref:Uncharacterized protein n=1 Tax=Veillonella denticariosi JCM 15641 TaxID=1298594 RepID=A0A2S7ZCV3_9FIRM|nr:hypothetical protein [Veillonella denticariosi]PQL21059.1 hypothetical protein VEHSUH05_01155 [Veillonella denticariosi JCM 15641]
MKLKGKTQITPKFSEEIAEKCRVPNSKIMLSFGCVTSNKKYNFGYFKKDIRKNLNTREALDELLEKITSLTWAEASNLSKSEIGGFELIPFEQMTPIQIKNLDITKDTGIYTFRFNSNTCRLCGIKDKYCNVLYIIAYDFCFKLYNHGS